MSPGNHGNGTEEWKSQTSDRTEAFLTRLRDTSDLHMIAINCLGGVFERNPDRLRIGHRNIIIIGHLALYAIPIEQIMAAFLNPWANRTDLPRVEVHPLSGWVRRHNSACIQPPGASEEPGPDTIAAICEALLADSSLFMIESMTTFRSALFGTYGYGISPITEVLTVFLKQHGAEVDLEDGEIVIPGSYSWKWHLQFGDPEVSGFTLYSSIRDGPRRMHIADTNDTSEFSISPLECISSVMSQLRRAPRSLLHPNDQYGIRNSDEFRISVARVWNPLRRRMEEQGALDDEDLCIPGGDENDEDDSTPDWMRDPFRPRVNNLIVETIRSRDTGEGVEYNDLVTALEQGGHARESAEDAIERAREQGEVIEPRFGSIQLPPGRNLQEE